MKTTDILLLAGIGLGAYFLFQQNKSSVSNPNPQYPGQTFPGGPLYYPLPGNTPGSGASPANANKLEDQLAIAGLNVGLKFADNLLGLIY